MLRSFTLAWSCKRRIREIKILQQFLFSLLQNDWDVPSVDVWIAQHSGGKQRLFLFPSLCPDVSFLSGKLSGFDFLSQQVAIYTTLMSHSLENLLSSNICEKSCLNIWWVGRPRYGSCLVTWCRTFFDTHIRSLRSDSVHKNERTGSPVCFKMLFKFKNDINCYWILLQWKSHKQ